MHFESLKSEQIFLLDFLDRKSLLQEVSLSVKKGEMIALLGESGSGQNDHV